MKITLLYFLLLNFLAFLLYGIDKRNAIKGKHRIPESKLIVAAGLGGSMGALLAMYVFRHKIRKKKFCLGVPLILVLQFILVFYISELF